ncbi:toll/interleukin-1 receptor domain-containing protein [Pseudoalteromonas sp. NZS127]|uniref:toll/interleukin-1 receptor domain-containing protein n=1 Tax=Pseudoalteromonas TaxID=53246 RepID=UPI0018CEA8B6|nr:toll/interleukin-1 receptor domain-containing protein [Pseudoalteromonas sp. NZS127]MBH0072231.1 toll/interleukin-1 receptor domain-containing protein [Pseudoalteromonas sp. NZS127]|tara:strand:+ start:1617 stop:2813 length:1197 start_codon:yes stop_codon:yes gene_type:complete
MTGIVKKKYLSQTRSVQKSLSKPLDLTSKALPLKYDKYILLEFFKLFFPIEWTQVKLRYELYESKDSFLNKVGKKKRYFHDKPDVFFYRLPKVKHMLSYEYKINHKNNHDAGKSKTIYKELLEKAKKRQVIQASKQEILNKDLQIVEPLYIDVFISAYHKKGIKITEKIEIFNELKKYRTKKVITFFQKLNDSEKNDQIRVMAFDHIQKLDFYVNLRKKFKGKVKPYQTEKSDFIGTPEHLYQLIEGNRLQNKKSFHVFISHSFRDTKLVKKLKSCLNMHGLTVYCDWTSDNDFLKRELLSDYTKMVLKKRIEQSGAVIFLETKNSMEAGNSIASPWIIMEIEYAISISKPIFYLNFYNNNSPFKLITHTFNDDNIEIQTSELERIFGGVCNNSNLDS